MLDRALDWAAIAARDFIDWGAGALRIIRARLGEKTTLVSMVAGVGAASTLEAPWSYISLGLATVAAMVPDDAKDAE